MGIKGIAQAALAVYCRERGFEVSGSDAGEEFPSDAVLAEAGIRIDVGFDVAHISARERPDLVIYTGAHQGIDNLEVQEALKLGIKVLPHGKALGMFMNDSVRLSVAGSHGKTTTSAMLAAIFFGAGLDPSYAIGSGKVGGLGLPGHFGRGKYFIAEADEYVTDPKHDPTPRFLWQKPNGLVITNIDYDHPDVYVDLTAVQMAFQKLIDQMPDSSCIVYDHDDANSANLYLIGSNKPIFHSVGFTREADFTVGDFSSGAGKTKFVIYQKGKLLAKYELLVPGEHNAKNAAQAAILAYHFGIDWQISAAALAKFSGAKRRFEKIGVWRGMTVYDDYAHHPQEIAATLKAAREWWPAARIRVVFQPHTYTRTKALLAEFAASFGQASELIYTSIYASAREIVPEEPIMENLLDLTKKYLQDVKFIPNYQGVVKYLHETGKTGDIIIIMGAGDIYNWNQRLMQDLH